MTEHPRPPPLSAEPAPVPLLLLPGTLCDARLFRPVLDALGGYPATVADMTAAASTAELAGAILACAPPSFALAGFSLGGIVALEMIAQAPGRVRRLALIDTTARPDPPANAAIRRRAVAEARSEGIDGYIVKSWDRLVSPGNRNRSDLFETIIAMARDGGAEVLSSQSEVAITRADSRPRLPAIGVPTLVLAGEAETICPIEAHREIAEAIPQAELHLVPGAGHFTPLENSRATALHLRRWLGIEANAFET